MAGPPHLLSRDRMLRNATPLQHPRHRVQPLGSVVEGPFDRDGSSFGMPLDLICCTITADLLGSGPPLARLPVERDPRPWS